MTIEWREPARMDADPNKPLPRAYLSKCERACVNEYASTHYPSGSKFEVDSIIGDSGRGVSWPISGRPVFGTLEEAGAFVERFCADNTIGPPPSISPIARWDLESRAKERAAIVAWLRERAADEPRFLSEVAEDIENGVHAL